jgi:hypothetical protein
MATNGTRKNLHFPSPSATEQEEDDPAVKLQPTNLKDYFFPAHRLKCELEGIAFFVFKVINATE